MYPSKLYNRYTSYKIKYMDKLVNFFSNKKFIIEKKMRKEDKIKKLLFEWEINYFDVFMMSLTIWKV